MTYKDQLSKVYGEIEIMKHLKESGGHHNIVQLHEVLDDEEKDKLYMGIDTFPFIIMTIQFLIIVRKASC